MRTPGPLAGALTGAVLTIGIDAMVSVIRGLNIGETSTVAKRAEQGYHYRIDINTVPPSVNENSWQLRVSGLVQQPLEFTLDPIRTYARPISSSHSSASRIRSVATSSARHAGPA